MPRFDFDTEIDRRAVPALKTHRIVLGEDGGHLFPGGVADMDFPAAPCIQQAIAKRAAHGVYGYEALPDGLIPALTAWMQRRHGWTVAPEHVLRAPNVLNALAMTANTFTEPGDGIIIPSSSISPTSSERTAAESSRRRCASRPDATRWISRLWRSPRVIRERGCCSCAIRTTRWDGSGPATN